MMLGIVSVFYVLNLLQGRLPIVGVQHPPILGLP